MGLPGTGNSMCKSTEVREHLLGLGYARSSLGLDQKVQAGAGPAPGLEERWARLPRTRSTGPRSEGPVG